MEKICFNKKEVICSNKTSNMVRVDIVKDIEIVKVTLENMHNTFSLSRFGIQLTQNYFKLIKFGDNEKKQAKELVRYKDIMVDMINISDIEDNNRFLFKNNIEYT